jgi:uroporphyrinogen-III synthase
VRVLVTRPRAQAEPLVDALRSAGHEPVVCPLIEVEPIEDGPIDVRGYDWVVVTSANGASELARRHVGPLPRVAAVGTATAAALSSRGIRVDFVPREQTQDGLVAEFPRPSGRVLFVGAERARPLLARELGADFRVVYRTRTLRPTEPVQADVAILASSSAARALAALHLAIPAVVIGPQTAATARELGLAVLAEARSPDPDALVAALRETTG